ncbi:MAG: sulfite reductase subunit alpha [Burkholderiaceae bacterium]
MMNLAEPVRMSLAAGLSMAYVLMCLAILLNYRRRHATELPSSPQKSPSTDWIIAYASQTGSAEELARKTASALEGAGIFAQLFPLSSLQEDHLRSARRILFIVSTYGEGDAPDNAAAFADRMVASANGSGLEQLQYGILALGDRQYKNFCGFGKSLDQWLLDRGANALFARIDADQCDAAALEEWRSRLSGLAGFHEEISWESAPFQEWRLAARMHLNAGSIGQPVYHLELEPHDEELPEWQSGDLVQVRVPGDMLPREYSIASIYEDGRIHLLIRQQRRPDGSLGLASVWLTQKLKPGEAVSLRLRRHPSFRLEDNARRPLILIGNGTGIAGLRSHIRERAQQGMNANWLIFGERHAACDFHYQEEIEAWRQQGVLQRTDLCFSRDSEHRPYVQDRIKEASEALRDWVRQDAAIYVCGSLKGMAEGVDAALKEILGPEMVSQLSDEGRYRRDVY